MNRTGDTPKELGLYASECCGIELIFGNGDTFCRCPRCSALCKWEMLDVVIPWTALEQEDTMVAA